MVVLTNPSMEDMFLLKHSKPRSFSDMPTVDLSLLTAAADIVAACTEFGFFKVTNHGVSKSLVSKLEAAAGEFFALPEFEKEKAVLANPFGYGNKKIGSNGDVGWLEYLLLEVSPSSAMSLPFLKEPFVNLFCSAMNDYVSSMGKLASFVLELMAEGLGIEEKKAFSKLVDDDDSDVFFRLNHYPPSPTWQGFEQSINGFGEHTDPQIISLLRSNDCDGLQIALQDGTWVLVPSDQDSFFINVGDSLQVLTNGRFRSVRHRVVTNGARSRLSMIYFGGAPLSAMIAPLPELVGVGGTRRYGEFTWAEYKAAAFKTRLADNRLREFEKEEKEGSENRDF